MTVKNFLFVFLVTFTLICKAQDPTFSQFYASGLYLNPANIALEETNTLTVQSRTQWKEKSIGANFQTNQASLILPIARKEVLEGFWGGFGLSVYQDKSLNGAFVNSGANLSVSTNVKMSKKSQLTLGLQGGVIQKEVSLETFKWSSQYNPFIGYDESIDPNISFLNNKAVVPDLSAGILYYYNYNDDFNDSKWDGFVGFSAYHLNQANESLNAGTESKIPIIYKVYGGMDVRAGTKIALSPNVLAASQGTNFQFNGGLYMSYMFSPLVERWNPAFVMIGSWYRLQDSFIFSAGLGGTYYSIAFSYDMNTSNLRQLAGNVSAYEISFKLKQPAKRLKSHHTPRM